MLIKVSMFSDCHREEYIARVTKGQLDNRPCANFVAMMKAAANQSLDIKALAEEEMAKGTLTSVKLYLINANKK